MDASAELQASIDLLPAKQSVLLSLSPSSTQCN